MKYIIVFLFAALVVSVSTPHGRYAPPHHLRDFENIMAKDTVKPKISGPVVNVLEFGADPTSTVDSTPALQRAIDYAMSLCVQREMADGIKDCNGVVINLQGGSYLLHKTIEFPIFTGNWRMTSGTLRASDDFDPSSYLVKVGGGACTNKQQSCNQGIGFDFMMFDSSHQSAGGIEINHTMGANFGPQNFVIGFNRTGVMINSGHETFIHVCWFGEYYYSDDRKFKGEGTAIIINGNDHYILDTIVYGGKIGAIINGEANVLKGFHTWNLDRGNGGVGIIVNAGVTRMENCYLDFNDLIITKFYLTVIQDTFFLGNGRTILKPHGDHDIVGFRLANSMYGYGGDGKDTVEIDESNGHIRNIVNTHIVGTVMQEGVNTIVETEGDGQLHQKEATEWEIDFSTRLLFKHIEKVQWSFVQEDETFYRAIAKVEGTKIIVKTDVPITGTLHVHVDSTKDQYYCLLIYTSFMN